MVTVDTQTIRSLTRWRAGSLIAALVVPAALFGLFERQARRLDQLARDGVVADARVTGFSNDGHTTFYAYDVRGVEHTWDVRREEAPFAPGETFRVVYSAEDPALSVLGSDRQEGHRAAAKTRGFAWKLALGAAMVFVLVGLLTHRDLRRKQYNTPPELSDPVAYRRRILITSAAVLLPVILLVVGWHMSDAMEKGQSVVPVVLASVITIALLGGVLMFVTKNGPVDAQTRSARLIRWLAPLAIVIGLARLVVALLDR